MHTGRIGDRKAARTIFYIIFVSGLLSLTSTAIMLIWNNTITKLLELASITFLEAVGIVSFVYVIYFGIKFGDSAKNDILAEESLQESHNCDKRAASIPGPVLNKLDPQEKKQMIDLLNRCCGYNDRNDDPEDRMKQKQDRPVKNKQERKGLDYIL